LTTGHCRTSIAQLKPIKINLDAEQFRTDKIHKAIKKLKPKFIRDPEGFPAYLVKQLITALPGPLSLLFNSSLDRIPSSWKKAIITPIYKTRPSSEPANNNSMEIRARLGAARSLTTMWKDCTLGNQIKIKLLKTLVGDWNLQEWKMTDWKMTD